MLQQTTHKKGIIGCALEPLAMSRCSAFADQPNSILAWHPSGLRKLWVPKQGGLIC